MFFSHLLLMYLNLINGFSLYSSLYKMNKVFCNRTKKRKVQRELDALGDWYTGHLPDDLNSAYDILPVQETFHNATHISSTVNRQFNSIDSDLDQSDQLVAKHNISISNVLIENVLESSNDDFINIYKSKYNQQEDILQSLAHWAIDYNVPQNTINKLKSVEHFLIVTLQKY